MQDTKIVFITSKPDVQSCPETVIPEYAFIGRSNVGKSSLINMLANNHKLAKTSSMPGKTRLINYFLANDAWYLVDLPGYGYAKISKKEKEKLKKIVNGYVLKRKQLICLFVLIDIRHEALKTDLEFLRFLGENGVPLAIVFTKSDKIKDGSVDRRVKAYLEALQKDWENLPPHFITSSEKGTGKQEIMKYIDDVNDSLK